MMRLTPVSAAFGALATTVPLVATFAPVQVTALFLLFAVPLALLARRRAHAPFLCAVGGILLCLILWGGITLSWSIVPDEGLKRLTRLPPLLALGVLALAIAVRADPLTRWTAARAVRGGVVVGVVTLILLSLNRYFVNGAFDFGVEEVMGADLLNYTVGGTCIAGLALILLAREIDDGKHVRALAGAALVGLIVAATQSTTALVAYGIGVSAFLAAIALPRVTGPAIAVAIPVAILAAPWLPDPPFSLLKELSSSGLHRAAIWHFTIDRIHEAQFLGWGLDSARDLPGGRELVPDNFFGYKVRWVPQWHQLMQLETAELLPLHPHNNSLQVWLELGFPGAVLFAALHGGAAVLIIRDRGRGRAQKAGLLAVLCYLFVVASASFGVWQSWWVCLQVITWVLALAVLTTPRPVPPHAGRAPDTAGT